MIDCAAFENRLTEVLGGTPADAEGLAQLRRHAETCSDCRGALALVDLAGLPIGERDPVPAPPEGYWDGFNAAVGARLEREPARRPGQRWKSLVAAASIVVALAGGWLLRGWWDPVETAVNPPATGQDAEWSSLEEVIRQATPEELAEALRGLPGGWDSIEASGWELDDAGIGGAWIPDAAELDEEEQAELMEWLDQVDRAEGRPKS